MRKSRSKRKCPRALNHPSRARTSLSLTHIAPEEPTRTHLTGERNLQGSRGGRSTSRPKVKCLFGPRHGRQPTVRNEPIIIEELHPEVTAPSVQVQDSEPPTGIRSLSTADLPPLPPATRFNVDRVTFTHPEPPQRSPFDRYRPTCAPAHARDPFNIALQRLGLLAEELQASISQEIDDLLEEIEASRRQELLEHLPFERRLTKDDCLRMFRNQALPTTGAMAGVLRWAESSNWKMSWNPRRSRSRARRSPHWALSEGFMLPPRC